MISHKHIAAATACFCICIATRATAQDNAGGTVTIHADPRLSVLLKKGHLTAAANTAGHTTEAAIKPATPPVAAAPAPSVAIIHHASEAPAPSQTIIHHETRTVYKGRGFRVQIYNGPDRNKAMSIKTEFMRHFPGIHSYIIYSAPAFRVKIGDYRHRSDAEGMLREANSMFRPSMIVPDEVIISTF